MGNMPKDVMVNRVNNLSILIYFGTPGHVRKASKILLVFQRVHCSVILIVQL